MKIRLAACLIMALAGTSEAAQDYRVGSGDVLAIKVLHEEDLTGSYVVSPDGAIAFPLVGLLPVRGRSLPEVHNALEGRLNSYIRYPVITVSLEKSNSRKIFVYGEVKSPGEYDLEDRLTVVQAIARAGGLARGASESKVKILRPSGDASGYRVIPVDLRNVLARGEGDPALEPNDIILVREGWF
jgi:protein involved in polysaccharide export with SLBB domain